MRTLYLGLEPKPDTYHYPVIQTVPLGDPKEALLLWDSFTHIIFTSKTTVGYWPGPWDKTSIAIGEATANALRKKGLEPLVAPDATQEGVIELISKIPNGYFFYPHSLKARSNLACYMQERKIPYFSLALYNTVLQKPEPTPSLDMFDEIIFTSPSTVEGFLNIYKKLPETHKLTAIGPITQKALDAARKDQLAP